MEANKKFNATQILPLIAPLPEILCGSLRALHQAQNLSRLIVLRPFVVDKNCSFDIISGKNALT
jgi:hypothetical protein